MYKGDFRNRRKVGICSQCGGIVSVPTVFWSVVPPVPSCEDCGAVLDERAFLPVVPTRPVNHTRATGWEFASNRMCERAFEEGAADGRATR